MNFGILLFCVAFCIGCVAEVRMDPGPREPVAQPAPVLRHPDLKVIQLTMFPDPVREGQRVGFEAIVANYSQYSARVQFFIQDRDEVVTQANDIWLRPGDNRIVFPQTNYRFSRNEYCFTLVVDIERTRRSIDLAKEFCVQRSYQGWTMGSRRIGPLKVEDLDFIPDPVLPGQEVQFKATLRNEGSPVRADVRILDGEQAVTRLNDVLLPQGISNLMFPRTQYQFKRFDHCFTVIVDVERTPYRVDAARQFCAKPKGWTLNPQPRRP